MIALCTASHLRRAAAGSVLAAFILTTPGCYGTFPATNAVYRFNGSVTDSTVVHSVIMVVLVIFPVYSLCMFVDAIVLNSIEFWTGDSIDVSRSVDLPDGARMTLAPGATPGEATLTLERDGRVIERRTYVRVDSAHTSILASDGSLLSVVECLPDGSLVVRDAEGRPVAEYGREQIAALAAAAR